MKFLLMFVLLAALGFASADPAAAQRVGAIQKPTANAVLISPATLITIEDMDFGLLSVTGAGTATINPSTRALTTSGGVSSAGGSPKPATFMVGTRIIAIINITLPTTPIVLTRGGGTETMTVTNLTLDGSNLRLALGVQGVQFNVGGRLNVAANQRDGVYTGTFDVFVDYY